MALSLLLLVLVAVIARLLRAASGPQARPPRITAAVGLAALGGVWMLANQSVEGNVLVTVGVDHGLTVADLPAVALFVAAVAVVVWPRHRTPVGPRDAAVTPSRVGRTDERP